MFVKIIAHRFLKILFKARKNYTNLPIVNSTEAQQLGNTILVMQTKKMAKQKQQQ